ncbi:PhoH family protein [Candidatus Acetothermia bacterium]|nr:PhoH family protein [Candidatus Acetothermia bacterium]
MDASKTVVEIVLNNNEEATALLGQFNCNLNEITKELPTKIIARGDVIRIEGTPADVERTRLVFDNLLEIIEANHIPSVADVRYLIEKIKNGENVRGVLSDVVQVTHWGEEIRAKTIGQLRYVNAIEENDIVFAIGPAGTGKTYLAVAKAIDYLKQEKVKRIVLIRPAVEAGEALGFLPGDIQEKVNPYLRPLYDAIYDMLPGREVEWLKRDNRIEIAPLAFMRGRTLNNSFIILDEAQNTTQAQMKMFLTRLGLRSHAVITGDVTQIDLEYERSGLVAAQTILKGIDGIAFIYLDKADVVRHSLVKKIISAYAIAEEQRQREHAE